MHSNSRVWGLCASSSSSTSIAVSRKLLPLRNGYVHFSLAFFISSHVYTTINLPEVALLCLFSPACYSRYGFVTCQAELDGMFCSSFFCFFLSFFPRVCCFSHLDKILYVRCCGRDMVVVWVSLDVFPTPPFNHLFVGEFSIVC